MIDGDRRRGGLATERHGRTARAPLAGPGEQVASAGRLRTACLGALGMPWYPLTGRDAPAALMLDGSQLGPGDAWLRIERPWMWVRGMTLANCPVAIELVGGAVGATLIGTNGDDFNGEWEVVLYE